MHERSFRKTRLLLATVVAATGLTVASSAASAAPVAINLCAKAGTAALTGSVTVPIWGFGIPSTPGDCSTATASLPGPVLTVNEGDAVTINLANALPGSHGLQFEIPGVTFNAGLTDGSAPITFTAGAPGTYLYQSGGDGGRQEAMGLYGALIVRSATAAQAYDTPTTAYDGEATLVLSQVDPAFNADPAGASMYAYRATYWLLNGKAYPDAAPIPAPAAGSRRLLIRYVNAGHDNSTMLLLGMHERVLARDARLLSNPFLADAETIPAGGTEDVIATIPVGGAPSGHGFPLYNRQLHTTNGSPAVDGGGMLTFVQP